MRVLDLFSGIGGFALGLDRAGFETVAFCEIEPFPRAVLAKHWPKVPCYDDVRTLTAARLAADGIVPDVICGGFPCQDLSIAGKGAGLDGERSGLWREYARLIEEIRPRYVIIENVPPLRTRGLDQVLGRLASLGYDAEWHCIPASALGAPHRRDRVWIVAYRDDQGRRDACKADEGRGIGSKGPGVGSAAGRGCDDVANAALGGRREHGDERDQVGDTGTGQPADCGETLADASSSELPGAEQPQGREPIVSAADIWRAASERRWRRSESRVGGEADGHTAGMDGPRRLEARPVEPWEGNTPRTVGRGYPNRRPRLKALGNSIVPHVVEMIGRAILSAETQA